MSENIVGDLIAATSTVLVAIIGAITTYRIARMQFGPNVPKKPVWIYYAVTLLVGFVVGVGIFMVLSDNNDDNIESSANRVAAFDEKEFNDWAQIVAWDSAFGNPFPEPNNVQSRFVEDNGKAYYEYELAIDDDEWRHYTITYKKPVRAELITARFYLPDAEGNVEEDSIGLVALEPNQPPSNPRIAESLTAIKAGNWTLVVLDLRGRHDFEGQSLTSIPLELQISISLKGSSGISSNTKIRVQVSDINLFENVGDSSVRYASDGLSSFTPVTLLSGDVTDFPWETSRSNYIQESQPEFIRKQVDGIVGTFVEYPIHLASVRWNTWMQGLQDAELDRKLRDKEQDFDLLIANIYIASEESTRIDITPFIVLDGDIWQQGFAQSIPTNEWTTIVWTRMVDSTPYDVPNYDQALLALRDNPDEIQVGFIRLIQIVNDAQKIQRLGFQFRLESDLPVTKRDEFDGTIYLGNVSFFSY